MTTLREAATQALEALEGGADSWQLVGPAIDALKEALVEDAMQKFTDVSQEIEAALAEPVQEPVALDWLHKWANQDDGEPETQWHEGYEAARRVVQIHLTAPPQRPAETVQEPVAYSVGRTLHWHQWKGVSNTQLYLAPPHRKPLSEEEAIALWADKSDGPSNGEIVSFARAIERAHGIGGNDE